MNRKILTKGIDWTSKLMHNTTMSKPGRKAVNIAEDLHLEIKIQVAKSGTTVQKFIEESAAEALKRAKSGVKR